jgi:RHS repeat-associated protein
MTLRHYLFALATLLIAVTTAGAAVDLRGYNGTFSGGVSYPFDIQETTANWGDQVHIRFAVANLGNSASGAYKIGIFLSADSTIDPATDYRFFTYSSAGTAAGGGLFVNYGTNGTMTLPAVNPLAGAPSTVYIGMVVDVDNEVAESNEANNRNQGAGIDRDGSPLTITAPTPSIYVTDSAAPNNDKIVAFGSVANDGAGNARGVQTVTIINKGKATLTMNSLALTGSPYFSIVEIVSSTQNFISPSSLPRALAKNGAESWVITLQFDPAASAAATGTLTINSNDPATPALALSLTGTGEPVPDIALTVPEAAETDFGGVVQDGAGGNFATRTITLQNVGTGPLTVAQNGISLLTGAPYSVVSVTSSTQGALNLAAAARTMAAGGAETWAVAVKFDPAATGLLKDGLQVRSNDPDESVFTVSLTGQGVQPMQLAVTDSSGSPTDRAVAFPGVHADGAGKETASATLTLTNSGQAPLTVAQNGLTFLTGAHFKLGGVVSSTAGALDLSAGAKTIAGGNAETWTVTLLFDPGSPGSLTDTFRIASDNLAAATVTVALSGVGLNQPALAVADSVAPADDRAMGFGALLNDGPGNRVALQTVTLKNVGIQPLVVAQNGLAVTGAAAFQVVSVVSSTAGAINAGSASPAARTLAPAQAETWTVTLRFDPTANGSAAGSFDIASNDPVTPAAHVALTGQGATPVIALAQPSVSQNISAGSVFNIGWTADYPAGDGSIALYLDTDTNPANGLVPLASGLSEDAGVTSFAWRADPALAGGSYYVYATITDGGVTTGSYSPGRLKIDPVGAFQLRSSLEVTSPDYAYEYEYNGQIYTGAWKLSPGSNVVTLTTTLPDGNTATHQFTVDLVTSLTHVEAQTHDQLNRVETVKNGNGIVTTITYDKMGRIARRSSSNGAVVDFAYDVLGRRIRMTDYTGTTFYEWDDLSRLTAVIKSKNSSKGDADDLPLRYEYDLAGQRSAIVYPGGERVQYTYDDAGRMKTVNNVTRNLPFTYTYATTTGQLTKLSRPNGIETIYSYDASGRVTTIRHQRAADASVVAEFFYTLDAAGKATELRTTLPGNVIRREKYDYDRFDRLTQVIYADDGTIDANDRTVLYNYDGNGNRLTQTTKVNGVVTEALTYTYGNENRLLQVTDQEGKVVTEYRYDGAGNRVQKATSTSTTTYSYDERNLLVSLNDGISHFTFAYDGDGQRIGKSLNGITTTFINDASLIEDGFLQARNSSGTITKSTTIGISRLEEGGPQTKMPLDDRIGSARVLTDGTGGTISSTRFETFGTSDSPLPDLQFANIAYEAGTRLYFANARFYDATTGSFISKDPLGINAGANSFIYCTQDPVNRKDPLGTADSIVSQFWNSIDFNLNLNIGPKFPSSPKGPLEVDRSLDFAKISLSKNDGLNVAFGLYGSASGKFEGTGGGGTAAAGSGFNLRVTTDFDAAFFVQSQIGGGLDQGFKTSIKSTGIRQDTVVFFKSEGIDLKTGRQDNVKISAEGSLSKTGLGRYVSGDISVDGNKFASATENLSGYLNRQIDGVTDFISNTYHGIVGGGSKVGGVLLDKAAMLVGSNLSDLRGAVFDPTTGQFVFLGTDGSAAVKDVNLDYLYTALQAVYGSAVPPFVTLDPPASAYNQWTDFGNGNGVFEIGENGGFALRYNPIWPREDTTVDVTIDATWSGTNYTWTARFDCITNENINGGGRPLMKMVFNSWVAAPPAGVTLDTAPFQLYSFTGSSFHLGADGQDSYTNFTLNNASSSNYIVNSVRVYPGRQHRKFGGRVEGTQVGWVMLEADRVMKCLSVGKDNLTGVAYNSGTLAVTNYKNMAERIAASGGTGGNIRMWFTPNEMTLKRHLDPATGRASIVFDKGSVALNTESFILGLPQPAEAKAFADHFTANYDAFAAVSFPCVDPTDPAGVRIVNVKIFDMLRDVMRAVSLARFFRDNNVPVDMWWLNSWQPPYAYSPKSTPTAFNTQAGIVIYGGCQINKPNSYVPSASAKSVADVVQSSRPDMSGKPAADLKEQVWSAGTVEGSLKAVAASTTAEPQDGNMQMAEVDLSFPSPGALPLQFVRYYQSSWLGRVNMGPGWRYTPFALEFERPSWYDENSLMRGASGSLVRRDAKKDTRLRSGTVRVVDLRTGGMLDFASSLQLSYGVDSIGNPRITLSGLDANDLPAFTAGQRKSGATLQQFSDASTTLGYKVTTPDGAALTFDSEGRLLQTMDRDGTTQTYAYSADTGALQTITDGAGQKIALTYDTAMKLTSITGPADEKVNYTYTLQGCLERATHQRSGAYVLYRYNANNQLDKKTQFNGLTAFESLPDLKGRAEAASDVRGNSTASSFTQDTGGSMRTTQTVDPQINDPQFQPWQQQFDRNGRLLTKRDATGATTSLGYDVGSLAPNAITLPIAGRPAITVQRNAFGQPTRIKDPGNTGAQDVTATYDPATNQLRTITDPAGNPSELMYDASHRVQKSRRRLNGQNVDTGYGYYATGALRTVTDPLGKTVQTIGRDALDRVTSVTDATGIALTYEYDALGRLWKVRDPRLSSAVEYVYDNFDRVIEVKLPAGSLFYSYDPAKGWLTSQKDLLGRVTRYTRDAATGDVLQVVDEVAGGTNRVTAMSYNRYGQLASLTPPGAAPITFNFDALGRPLGSAEADVMPPGAPKALDSNHAEDGVPTYETSHLFTWGAPDSDSGIAGYSYAFDQVPADSINNLTATVLRSNVSAGNHTFQVKAKSNNGLWGSVAVFHLNILPLTPYETWRRAQFNETEVANEAVSSPSADPDKDGMSNLLEYVLTAPPKVPGGKFDPSLTINAGRPVYAFTRNLNATDVTLRVEASDSLANASWTPIATKTGANAWSSISGVTVSDGNTGPVTVTDVVPTMQSNRRFLRLSIQK